jgi:hypothetical protein
MSTPPASGTVRCKQFTAINSPSSSTTTTESSFFLIFSLFFVVIFVVVFFFQEKVPPPHPPPPFNLYSSLYHSFPMAALLFFFSLLFCVVGFPGLLSSHVTFSPGPGKNKKTKTPFPNALKVCTGYITAAALCLSKVMRIHFNCLIIIIVAVCIPLAGESLLPKRSGRRCSPSSSYYVVAVVVVVERRGGG